MRNEVEYVEEVEAEGALRVKSDDDDEEEEEEEAEEEAVDEEEEDEVSSCRREPKLLLRYEVQGAAVDGRWWCGCVGRRAAASEAE